MTDVHQVNIIRNKLKHAWIPFFTRFGRLTTIQLATIPKILENKNVILTSPTASGKTEAVVAPIAERLISERWMGLTVLYIVPTRALANDTFYRIEGPLKDMGIEVALKHGDKVSFPRKIAPNFLITTPESLDSLICRHPRIFENIRTLILDEIHILDNTYRGDQVRLLIHRLEQLSSWAISIFILSATILSPEQVALRYMKEREFEVIKVPGQRGINYHFLQSYEDVYLFAKKEHWYKILFFCNLRENVEIVTAQISKLWYPYPVIMHHGSLSRQIREEAESIMREADVSVCVATSTLEVGIDIGNIDLIVLCEPPWSISSLLQRIGRGNRKSEVVNVVAITTSEEERNLMDLMFKAAISGSLPVEQYKPDVSVAIQQIFSYLYQCPEGLAAEPILQLISPLCSEIESRLIISHLRKKGWIEYRAGRYFASTKLLDLGEKGRIHSNIPDPYSYKVVDIDMGIEIGRIAGIFDEEFMLGGKVWQVICLENNILKVRNLREKIAAPNFQKHKDRGAFYWLLPSELRNR